MLLISRKVIQQTKQQINLKSLLTLPGKTHQVLAAKNYQVLRQKTLGDLLNKTSISSAITVVKNNHVSSNNKTLFT